MHRCAPDQADLLLDGVPYQFQSPEDADAYVVRLTGFQGAVFTALARQRWGFIIPAAPPSAPVTPARGETWGRRAGDTETLPLPVQEDPP
jgi:hypothetical protein